MLTSARCATTTAPLKDGRLAGPNAADIIAILTEYTEIKTPETFASMTAFAVNPDGQVNTTSPEERSGLFKERRLVDGKMSVDQVIDHSFAEEAVRVLGAYKDRR